MKSLKNKKRKKMEFGRKERDFTELQTRDSRNQTLSFICLYPRASVITRTNAVIADVTCGVEKLKLKCHFTHRLHSLLLMQWHFNRLICTKIQISLFCTGFHAGKGFSAFDSSGRLQNKHSETPQSTQSAIVLPDFITNITLDSGQEVTPTALIISGNREAGKTAERHRRR